MHALRELLCSSAWLGGFPSGAAGAASGTKFAAHQRRDLERRLESERRRLIRLLSFHWFTRFVVRSVSGVQRSLQVFNTANAIFADVARVAFRLTGLMSLNHTNNTRVCSTGPHFVRNVVLPELTLTICKSELHRVSCIDDYSNASWYEYPIDAYTPLVKIPIRPSAAWCCTPSIGDQS